MKKIIVLLFALVLLVGCTDAPVKTNWKLTYSIHLPDTTIVKVVDFQNGDQYGRAWISTNRKGTSNTLYVRPSQVSWDYPIETSLCPIVIESFEAIKP